MGFKLQLLELVGQKIWKGKVFYRQERLLAQHDRQARDRRHVPRAASTSTPPSCARSSSRRNQAYLLFPARLYCGQSLLDGRRESVIIDYAFTDEIPGLRGGRRPHWAAATGTQIRDEIRMVRPGFYLGRAYLSRVFALNFTLRNAVVEKAGRDAFVRPVASRRTAGRWAAAGRDELRASPPAWSHGRGKEPPSPVYRTRNRAGGRLRPDGGTAAEARGAAAARLRPLAAERRAGLRDGRGRSPASRWIVDPRVAGPAFRRWAGRSSITCLRRDPGGATCRSRSSALVGARAPRGAGRDLDREKRAHSPRTLAPARRGAPHFFKFPRAVIPDGDRVRRRRPGMLEDRLYLAYHETRGRWSR